ncbi:polysaccharide biosynthesis/export family protein [Pontivivens insulae]|uniref:Soluble ligand binding domain-containing protein n=1 Tax=Pontivivens insulae TaxID=1639689 RepID=A0A2R8ABS7_9RHOB|nr:polysaccharide biosynthesis/export family protein [Pontivivens insulae]RED11159.1 polysaccharide export outer membrane protein [Pontivivens insulae]SPF29667.1 hypothetical protein POI8812_01983 [Pontivivens insulae]
MKTATFRAAATVVAFAALAGCASLPRSGPTIEEITAQPADGSPAIAIIPIDAQVARDTQYDEPLFFSPAFQVAGLTNIEVIQPLDVLDITVWENGQFPLFGGGEGSATTLGDMRVGLDGRFFMPQVGMVRASGRSIEQIRRDLTSRLAEMTPEPQVEVRLTSSGSNTVRVIGAEGPIGDVPIEAATRTLAGLMANVAASGVDTDVAQVSIRRGDMVSRVWLEDVLMDPDADIALRGGDIISIERDPRSFIALGELGSQTSVEFPGRDISLMEAIATMGGLNPNTADPRGVFVLREEEAEVYSRFATPPDSSGTVRVAYVLDLTAPAAFFTASSFSVRDDDIVYVSEAPYVQFLKIVGAISPPIQAVTSTASVLDGS